MGRQQLLDLEKMRHALANSEKRDLMDLTPAEAFTLGGVMASVRLERGQVAVGRRSVEVGTEGHLLMGAITHLTEVLVSNAGDDLTGGVCSSWLVDEEAPEDE
jgi:hypothetical protein